MCQVALLGLSKSSPGLMAQQGASTCVNTGSACALQDLIISTSKLPAPLAIVTTQDAEPGQPDGMDSPAFLDR